MIRKIIIASIFSLISNISLSATTTASVGASATLIPGCVIEQPSYTSNMGNIIYGTTGSSSVSIKFTCSTGVVYKIQPVQDVVIYNGIEDVYIRAFKDSLRTQPLTASTPIQGTMTTANTNQITTNIYFKANGVDGKRDKGTGAVLTEAQSFSINFPITIIY